MLECYKAYKENCKAVYKDKKGDYKYSNKKEGSTYTYTCTYTKEGIKEDICMR